MINHEWIEIDSAEDVKCDTEVLLWDGHDYHLDYVDIDTDTGVRFFANGPKEVTHYKLLVSPTEAKSITTISGSKYSYTEQQGDALVSYGFDTFKELSDCIVGERNRDEEEKAVIAHSLVAELATVLKKHNADLTYTDIQVDGKTVARREHEQWVIDG